MRFLEGLPVPGNVVMDGLGHDLVSLIKDWIARCQVSGITSSRKCGPGWPGPGYAQFDKGLDSEMRFVEGWPDPGNIVLGGLGQDMVSLIKD